MPSLTIVTNNSVVRDNFDQDDFAVEFVDGTPVDVLARVVVLLQEHKRLVSAPLPPNVPMMRAPFRSILITENGERYDIPGIEAVENARKTMVRQRGISTPEAYETASLDFAEMDRTYLERGIRDYGLIGG